MTRQKPRGLRARVAGHARGAPARARRPRTRLVEILDRVQDGFVALDRDWRYTYVNARAGEMFGRRPEDLVGKHIWTEFPEGVGQPFHRAYERALETQQPIVLEDYYEPWQRWFENRIYPSPDGLSIYFHEITERKRAERALRESEERYRRIVETAEEGIWVIDAANTTTFANGKMARMLGLTVEEMLGRHLFSFMDDEGRRIAEQNLERRRQGVREQHDFVFRRNDGSPLVASLMTSPMFAQDGSYEGALAMLTDVTEQRRLEAGLREAAAELQRERQHLELAQAQARLGSWERDLVDLTGYWSGQMYALFGRDPRLGPPDPGESLAWIHPDDREALLVPRTERVPGSVQTLLVRSNPADGPIRQLETRLEVFLDAQGRPHLLGTLQDVTEREALLVRERRAREVAETLRDANLALTQQLDVAAVLETLLDFLGRLVPYDSANVLLLEDGRFRVRAMRGYERWTDASRTRDVSFDAHSNPLMSEILAKRAPILVRDSAEDARWERAAGAEHVRSWIGVPLLLRGEVLGLFSVDKTLPDFFDAEHVRLAEALAPAAATAIDVARTDAALRESEACFRLFVRYAPAAIAMFDREMRYLAVSERWVSDYRLEDTDLVGRSHYDIFPHYPEQWRRVHRRVLAGATERAEADPFPREDGSVDWVRWEMLPWRTADGAVGGALLFSEVITERKQAQEALRESEERLRLALDAAHMGTFDWDVPRDRITWSRWHEELWGFAPGEFGGTYAAFAERVHPEDLPGIDAEVARCIAAREPFAREFRVVWPDASVHWVQARGEFDFDGSSRPVRMRGAVVETTARKKAEEALRQSEGRLRNVIDGLGPHVFVGLLTPDGTLLEANKPALEMAGLERTDVVGKRVEETYWFAHSGEARSQLKAAIERAALGEPSRFDTAIQDREGRLAMIDFSVTPLRDDTGRVVLLVPSARDVTERKRAEDALRESETRLRRIFEQASDGIFVITAGNRYLDANARGLEMLGYSREELLRMGVADVLAPHERPRLDVEPVEMLAGKPHLAEWVHLRKDGSTFLAEVSARRLSDESYLAILRDLSERRRLEEQVRRSETMAALGTVVAGVAHEIRNPLFAMSSTLEAFEERFAGHEAPHLGVLRGELERLNRLAGDLLDYGRPPHLELQALALADTLASAVHACEPLARGRGVAIRVGACELPPLAADRGRLHQVLQNLIDNAVRHSPRGATVSVVAQVERDDGREWICARVEDEGPGFAAEALARAFEPFFSRRKGGTGLGLSIARTLVEMHGGTIAAANRPEGGAVLALRLPVAAPRA